MAYRDSGEGALARIKALEKEVERLRSAAAEQVAGEKIAAYQRELERMEQRFGEQQEQHNARLVSMHEQVQEMKRRFREELDSREAQWQLEHEYASMNEQAAHAYARIRDRDLTHAQSWVNEARKAGGLPPASYHQACIANLERELERVRAREQAAETKCAEVETPPPAIATATSPVERARLERHHALAKKRAALAHDQARSERGQIESSIAAHKRDLDQRG